MRLHRVAKAWGPITETGGGREKTGTLGFGKGFGGDRDLDLDLGLDFSLGCDIDCDINCDVDFRLVDDVTSSTGPTNGTSCVTWGREASLRSLGDKTFMDSSL